MSTRAAQKQAGRLTMCGVEFVQDKKSSDTNTLHTRLGRSLSRSLALQYLWGYLATNNIVVKYFFVLKVSEPIKRIPDPLSEYLIKYI